MYKRGPQDTQDARVHDVCDQCGGEIYEGTEYILYDGRDKFCDRECYFGYMDDYVEIKTAGRDD